MSDYDYKQLFALIDGSVKSNQSAALALQSVVEYCARIHSSPDWAKIRALDIESDIGRLAAELSTALSARPIPAKLDGLYFGLYNPVCEGDDGSEVTSAGIYAGANPYDNGDPDWVCNLRWRSYLVSQGLHEMYQIAYAGGEEGLGNRAEYPLGLAYGALLVRDLSRKLDKLILGKASSRYIVVGFDSGDFLCVGRLDGQGLRFSTRQDEFAL